MTGARRRSGPAAGPLIRVAARLTTPTAYLGVLGGLQVLVLWMLRGHFGWWLPLSVTVAYVALLALVVRVAGHWRLKVWCVGSLGVLVAIGPTLTGIVQRPRIGLTMEHDGLLQVESAIDRLLAGRPIYGVDWSSTPVASFPWDLTPGGNPALHHMAYYPLTVLVGVPFRLVTGALGLPFDYRIVLIAFACLGLGAIAALPIHAERRVMLLTAVYLSPLITLYLWAGRNDIEFLAVVLLSLALLTRGHPTLAAAALGVAAALKPFAWVAVPFLLLVLYLRWRDSRSIRAVVLSVAALAIVPVATVAPFVLADPSAFWLAVARALCLPRFRVWCAAAGCARAAGLRVAARAFVPVPPAPLFSPAGRGPASPEPLRPAAGGPLLVCPPAFSCFGIFLHHP